MTSQERPFEFHAPWEQIEQKYGAAATEILRENGLNAFLRLLREGEREAARQLALAADGSFANRQATKGAATRRGVVPVNVVRPETRPEPQTPLRRHGQRSIRDQGGHAR